jgi:alginate O-acetyltransferase complex protein AlgJ
MATDGIGTDRPVSPLDREEIARVEVGHTNVSPRLAGAMVGWFLLMLALLPLAEGVGQLRARDAAGPWLHLARLPDAINRRLATLAGDTRQPGAWSTLVTANRAVLEGLSAFETALEDQSEVGRALRPQTQRVLSGWLGAGNERVYVGRDGWLFYRPDVEYLTGRGFLEPRELERRIAAPAEYENPPQPDPRPAIRQFKRDLEARGIALVLMPTPVKPMIHPGQLAGATPRHYNNASYQQFVGDMRRDGVLVFDPAVAIGRASGAPHYLVADTHWRPGTMQRVAEALVAFLNEHVGLQPVASPGYRTERREAQQIGDTAAMLDLPPDQTLYPRERVTLRFVTDSAGDPWRSSRDADILLLGDSFTNMYSLATMGWGESAGLAEQLSYTLQRPVDRIVQNDQGAHATRGLLRGDMGGATDRLAGKRVVIWQFAARELAFGDWQLIEIPPE